MLTSGQTIIAAGGQRRSGVLTEPATAALSDLVQDLAVGKGSGSNGGVLDRSQSFWMLLFSAAMIVGPTVGYIGQIAHVRQHRTADGYSPLVSVILLVCNTLRVLYWLGARFALMLLLQSLVMILVQMLLIVTVLKVTLAARLGRLPSNSSSSSTSAGGFLSWTPREFATRYLLFVASATIAMSLVIASFSDFINLVGYLALGIEATLVLPQIQLNYSRKSVAGVSLLLVATWCIGDVVKLVYFVAFDQPEPFVVCGSFQLLCDAVVVYQLWQYRQHSSLSVPSAGDSTPSVAKGSGHVGHDHRHHEVVVGPAAPAAVPTPPLAGGGGKWRSEWL